MYVVVERDITVGEDPGTKYVARILHSGTIYANEMVKSISRHCQVSQPVVLAVIKALELEIAEYINDGFTVELPALGKFMPIINSESKDTPEEVDHRAIKRLKIKFYPSVDLNQALKNASPERANLNITGWNPET
jgi:predicted histone-like DNA-binding protein